MLENQDHIRLLEEVASGLLLEPVICRLQPHVVLIDEAIPGIDVFVAIPQIRRRIPETRFIVYVDADSPAQRERCLASGISGLLVKVPSFTDTIHAIYQVARGGTFFPGKPEDRGEANNTKIGSSLSILTEREKAVLQQIVSGKKRKEIAQNLLISTNTVKTHRKSILEKLGLTSEADLIKVALGYEWDARSIAPPKSS